MKKILLYFIIMLLAAPAAVMAHTSLSESNPRDGETVEVPIEAVELFFEGTIEEQSTFELVDENGDAIPVDIIIEEDRMTGHVSESLPNGSYTVNWTVVGADGHPIEGTFSFEVVGLEEDGAPVEDATEEDPTEEETEGPVLDEAETEDTDDNAGEEASENEQTSQQSDTAAQETGGTSPVLIGLLVFLGIVILISGVWLLRRK